MTRETEVHALKTWPAYFQAIWDGRKAFEIRRDDRRFTANDTLMLREFIQDKPGYTGRFMLAVVQYVMSAPDMGLLQPGVVAMQLHQIQRFKPK